MPMDMSFSQRCISQRISHNSNNVFLMGEEFFFLGDVCTVAGDGVGGDFPLILAPPP